MKSPVKKMPIRKYSGKYGWGYHPQLTKNYKVVTNLFKIKDTISYNTYIGRGYASRDTKVYFRWRAMPRFKTFVD